jgi:hypothetical protein
LAWKLHYIFTTGGDITNILDCLIQSAPIYSELTHKKVAVSICDLDKCLLYIPAINLDHKLQAGDSHIQNTCAYECIKIGEKIERKVDFDNGRLTYYAVAIPVRDENGNIIGAISLSQNYKHNEMVNALTDNLLDSFINFKDLSNQVLNNAIELNELNKKFSAISIEVNKRLELFESYLKLLDIYQSKVKNSNISIDEGYEFININSEIVDLSLGIEEIIKLSSAFETLLDQQINSNKYIVNTTEFITERLAKLKEQVDNIM